MSIASLYPQSSPSLLLDFANTKVLDPRITFTRASEGRFYDGRTFAKAEENLLLQSQDFTTSWAGSAATTTANTSAAPDGTATADTITATATTNIHLVGQSFATSSLPRVLSIFAKAGTHNFLQICVANDAVPFANFDLGSGAVGTKDASVTSSITSVGNGWYRCTMEFSSTTGNVAEFALVSSASAVRRQSWAAVGTETILLWGAQLEQRSTVTAYTPTTTQPITNYIPVLQTAAANVARFDHNPTTGESLGLLIEEQRTNFAYPSNMPTSTVQTITGLMQANGATQITSGVPAPDGSLNGFTVSGADVSTNTSGANNMRALTVMATAGTYTISMWIKTRLAGTTVSIREPSSNTSTSFATTASWTRVSFTATSTSSNQNFIIWSTSGTPFDCFGVQVEAGAFPTSYIPTVAAQATRQPDAASMTGTNFSSWYRQSEGSLYADVLSAPVNNIVQQAWYLSDSSTNNVIFTRRTAGGQVGTAVVVAGVTQGDVASGLTISAGASYKSCFAYKVNDLAIATNAGAVVTDTLANLPVVDRITIGAGLGSAQYVNGHIRRIAYYPARLTNAQLQALTT